VLRPSLRKIEKKVLQINATARSEGGTGGTPNRETRT